MKYRWILLIAFFLFAVPSQIRGNGSKQETSLEGTLVTPSGEALPDTELLFVHTATRTTSTIKTDREGRFGLLLPIGEYEIYKLDPSGKTYLTRLDLSSGEVRGIRLKPSGQEEASLAAIRDYGVDISGSSQGDKKKIADLINPFPAKKRGRFFGSIYEFHRNDNFDAPNFFDPPGEPLPEFKRNQFGFTLGFMNWVADNLKIPKDGDALDNPLVFIALGILKAFELDQDIAFVTDDKTGKPVIHLNPPEKFIVL